MNAFLYILIPMPYSFLLYVRKWILAKSELIVALSRGVFVVVCSEGFTIDGSV